MFVNRPVEYDPSLIRQVAPEQYTNREQAIKDEFGLDDSGSDVESDEGDSADESFDASTNVHAHELARLHGECDLMRRAKLSAERMLARQDSRLSEMQSEHKKAKDLLLKRHQEQRQYLQEQLQETKAMVGQNEAILDLFKEQIESINGGADPAGLDQSALLMSEASAVVKANAAAKFKLEDMSTRAKKLKAALTEVDKERSRLRASLPEDGAMSEDEARAASLERERALYKEELETKCSETAQLQARLQELTLLKAQQDLEKKGEQSKESSLEQAKKQLRKDIEKETKRAGEMKKSEDAAAKKMKASEKALAVAEKKLGEQQAKEKKAQAAAEKEAKKMEDLLRSNAASKDKETKALQAAVEKAGKEVTTLAAELKKREEEMLGLKDKAKEKLTAASQEIRDLKEKHSATKAAYSKLKAAADDAKGAAEKLKNQCKMIEESGGKQKKTMAKLLADLKAARKTLAALKKGAMGLTSLVQSDTAPLVKAVEKYITTEGKKDEKKRANYKTEMELRRKYFNQVQEILGNVRCVMRVAPVPAGKEGSEVVKVPSEEAVVVRTSDGKLHEFDFESKILESTQTNEGVFQEVVCDVIQSALDGSNVNIFAYGPTSTGKSHTMRGQGGQLPDGMFGRAAQTIVRCAAQRVPDAEYTVSISVLSVGDGITDLLSGKAVAANGSDASFSEATDENTALSLVEKAKKAMNNVGAAEAVVLTIHVQGRNNILDKDIDAKVHLVDMASVEAGGASTKAFESVILAKATKKKADYALCPLTSYVQPEFGKGCKILLLVHLDPANAAASLGACDLAKKIVGAKSK